MKKSFQKTLIAASVGAVMLAAAGTASANSLLFPYFTTATGAQSIVSITASGTAASGSTRATQERLHYVYNYGDACTHYDGNGYVTANDVLQHSVAAPGVYGGVGLIAAPGGTDASAAFHLPLADQKGFLTVTNMTTAASAINGDMAIIDPATGLVVSYAGISNAAGLAEGDFSSTNNPGRNFGDNAFELSYFSKDYVTTSFYGVVVGNMFPAIAAGRDWKGGSTITNNGTIWNNDEVGFSGTVSKAITCAGTFTPSDLRTTAQTNAIGSNAGLIRATSTPATGATFDASTGLIVVKLQKILIGVGSQAAGVQLLHRVPVAN